MSFFDSRVGRLRDAVNDAQAQRSRKWFVDFVAVASTTRPERVERRLCGFSPVRLSRVLVVTGILHHSKRTKHYALREASL